MKKEIGALRKELAKDKSFGSYYYSWQSNVAMAFSDQLATDGYRLPNQHELCNAAAKRFLDNLIGDVSELEVSGD